MEIVTIWEWVAQIIGNLVQFFQWFGSLSITIGGMEFGVAGLLSVGLLGILVLIWMVKLIAG